MQLKCNIKVPNTYILAVWRLSNNWGCPSLTHSSKWAAIFGKLRGVAPLMFSEDWGFNGTDGWLGAEPWNLITHIKTLYDYD